MHHLQEPSTFIRSFSWLTATPRQVNTGHSRPAENLGSDLQRGCDPTSFIASYPAIAAWDFSADGLLRLAYREVRGHTHVFPHVRIYFIICDYGGIRPYVTGNRADECLSLLDGIAFSHHAIIQGFISSLPMEKALPMNFPTP